MAITRVIIADANAREKTLLELSLEGEMEKISRSGGLIIIIFYLYDGIVIRVK